MTQRVLIATTNAGKLREYARLLEGYDLELVRPADIGLGDFDVEETGSTFEANAALKAHGYAAESGLLSLADDSGIVVDALDGFPGVRSARWVAGSDEDRVDALLAKLEDIAEAERRARFQAVVSLAWPPDADGMEGRLESAAGAVEGRIACVPRGDGGFGYDPIFRVEDGGHDGSRTMAELPAEEKNRLSHRARAIEALASVLSTLS